MIRYDNFRLSLMRLSDQYKSHLQGNAEWPRQLEEALAESVVYRFRICYDSLCGVLRRYMIYELSIADVPRSPKLIFRLAFENHLLDLVQDQWCGYVKARVSISEDCDSTKIENCITLVPSFLDDAIRLYETMTGKKWNS